MQIYCNNDAEADFVEPLKKLVGELNRSMPFGSYQSTEDGLVSYRTHFFTKGGEEIKNQLWTTLQYARIFIRDHLPAILAVSTGLVTPELALLQLKGKPAGHASAE